MLFECVFLLFPTAQLLQECQPRLSEPVMLLTVTAEEQHCQQLLPDLARRRPEIKSVSSKGGVKVGVMGDNMVVSGEVLLWASGEMSGVYHEKCRGVYQEKCRGVYQEECQGGL